MKRKLSLILLFSLLLSLLCVLPAGAYTRLSYGADCLAETAELIKTALRGDNYTFSEADFKQSLGVTRVDNITVLSLPAAKDGVLSLGDTPVVTGQMIDRRDMDKLTFTPGGAGFSGTSFTFCANSGAGTTAITCTLKVADKVNYAPTTEGAKESSLWVETQKGIAVYGQMHAADPEGDPLTFLVVSYPKKGRVTVTNDATGEFRYVPGAGKTGRDRFTYVARDAYGNYTKETTVTVTVNKKNSTLVYADMENERAYNAALSLAEQNIMLGSLEGDSMYFHPDNTVTRAEFTVMAMKSAGISPAAGVSETWFDDNEKISKTVRNYIATAQLYGYVGGHFDGTGLFFRPDEAITRAEAAVILNHIAGAATPAVLPTFADGNDIPVWARESVYALYDIGLFRLTEDGSMAAGTSLSRAEAAECLYALANYKK